MNNDKYFFYCDDDYSEIYYGYIYDVETTTSRIFQGKKKSNYLVSRGLQGSTYIDDFDSLGELHKDTDAVVEVIERKLLMYTKHKDDKFLKDINQDFDLYRYLSGDYYVSYYFCNFICCIWDTIVTEKQRLVNIIDRGMGGN